MTIPPEAINWDDHTHPPVSWATMVGPDVCVTWGQPDSDGHRTPLVWHWCSRVVWQADPTRVRVLCEPQWSPAGVGAHTLVTEEPLHLEPSLLWSDCCGMHGFIRDGRWVSA